MYCVLYLYQKVYIHDEKLRWEAKQANFFLASYNIQEKGSGSRKYALYT